MNEIKVSMRMFGAFRKYGEAVEFPVCPGSAAIEIKEALAKLLGEEARGLIRDSVLANDEMILPGDYIFNEDASLSILPPVCGG